MTDSKAFKGEAGAERRKFPRIPLKLRMNFQCLAKDSVSPAEEHLAEDLGAGGLAMRSRVRLEKNQILAISLYVPRAE